MVIGMGCHFPQATDEERQQGLVWLFPGIEGGPWSMVWVRRALRDGGVSGAVETRKWPRPWHPLVNLTDYAGNKVFAAGVAEEIGAYQRKYPGRPVDLVGFSGGAGIALLVAEALPEEVRLRRLVLVHAAVSPGYDLCPVLRRVDEGMVNLHSAWDWFMVGLGTSVFGTIDRKYEPSAGMKGFDMEWALRSCPELKAKVQQRGWRWRDLGRGVWGGHFAISLYHWNRCLVVPLLVREPFFQD